MEPRKTKHTFNEWFDLYKAEGLEDDEADEYALKRWCEEENRRYADDWYDDAA